MIKYQPIFILFLLILLIVYPFLKECNRRNSIKSDSKRTVNAVVITEKEYLGNSPVSHEFYYKYKFDVNGKEYLGTSFNDKFQPGDSIEIEYVIDNPNNNAPKNYYK